MKSISHISAMAVKVAAFAGIALAGSVAAAAPASAGPTFDGWICNSSPIPAGHVVTAINRSGCGFQGALFVTPARDSMWVCSLSPIPPGFVVTINRAALTCGGRELFIRAA